MGKDDIYRKHILEAIEKINRYVADFSFQEFSKDEVIQDAVVRELEIIGEASKNLSQSFKDKHKNLPWVNIAGMRDKLIHEYFGVDVEIVWQTIKEDLKILFKSLS